MILLRLLQITVLTIALAFAMGCGRATGLPNDDASADEQQLPFNREPGTSYLAPTRTLVPAIRKLPTGTPITIRLQSAVSSGTSNVGDVFEGTLDDPIMIEGQNVFARGAVVRGKVLAAKPSGHLKDPGYLRLALVSITAEGRSIPIETSSIFAKGGSHEKRNWAMIGGGTGAGALIGGLAGGGKGALIGSAVGAASGTGAAYATGKKEVSFGPERRITFRLAQPVEMP